MKSDGVDRHELELLLAQVAQAIAGEPTRKPLLASAKRGEGAKPHCGHCLEPVAEPQKDGKLALVMRRENDVKIAGPFKFRACHPSGTRISRLLPGRW